jgi:hypothetical protein
VFLKLQLDLVVVPRAELLIIIDGLKYFKQVCRRPA